MEVELKYAHDLTVRVSDNGTGMDPVVLEKGKRGHFGLPGMRERAERIGAKLSLVSSYATGTEITIVVPGSIVFRKLKTPQSVSIRSILKKMNSTSNPDIKN